jgi:acetyltransferase-like isoleucine patch superfamily enzyme
MPKSREAASKNRQLRIDDSVLEPDSEIRRLLKDRATSNFAKYMWLTIGRNSWWTLLHYELVTLFGGMPGALGLFCRQKLYPGLFRKCGRGVVFGRNVTIRHPHRIEIGNRVMIDDNVVLDGKGEVDCTIQIGDDTILGRNSILVCKGGRIELGAKVNISVNCTFISESQLHIGDRTLVAGHCYVIAGGNHGTNCSGVPFVEQPRIDKGGTNIMSNCWIGANATILDGVTVGPDAIVAAASMVNKTVPVQSIVGGVPAKLLKSDAAATLSTEARQQIQAYAS